MAGRCGEGIAFEFVLPPQGDRIGLDLMEAPAQLARFLNRHAPVTVESTGQFVWPTQLW